MITQKQLAAKAAELTHQFSLAKGELVVSKEGRPLSDVKHPEACAFCMVGFLQRAGVELTGKSRSNWSDDEWVTYSKTLGNPLIEVGWSDDPATTVEQVRQRFEMMAAA